MGGEYTIVGVLDEWKQSPRFFMYNGRTGAFVNEDDFLFRSAMRFDVKHPTGKYELFQFT